MMDERYTPLYAGSGWRVAGGSILLLLFEPGVTSDAPLRVPTGTYGDCRDAPLCVRVIYPRSGSTRSRWKGVSETRPVSALR